MSESKPSLPVQDAEIYIGDGLYASFDGWQIVLRVPREGGDHFVALEPEVFKALLEWVKTYSELAIHMGAT